MYLFLFKTSLKLVLFKTKKANHNFLVFKVKVWVRFSIWLRKLSLHVLYRPHPLLTGV